MNSQVTLAAEGSCQPSLVVDSENGITTVLDQRGRPVVRLLVSAADTESPRRGGQVSPHLGPLPAGWEERNTSTGRSYFVNHKTKVTTWEDPRLPHNGDPCSSFDRKLEYIRSQPTMRLQWGTCEILVRRSHLFEDACSEIMTKSPLELKHQLVVRFEGEDNSRSGSPSCTKELFVLLARELFSPVRQLFKPSLYNEHVLQINPTPNASSDHIQRNYAFVGRCMALSILHAHPFGVHFIPSYYKKFLKQKATLSDLGWVDAQLHNELVALKKSTIGGTPSKHFTISDEPGSSRIVELKPGGSDISVVEESKDQYIGLAIRHRLYKQVQEQLDVLIPAFFALIPANLVVMLHEHELEALMSGETS
ncbi:hypothetical protein JAAARDRAFT_205570 [Jaapia argillacea MUCL 33604]|uniref:HECT-type E3 ubiquitin transferase n=1 Tax=Jaapia argillacea MUCL 33604 TaxID=933084 RepID=A0A067QAC4_9AGAM|nr:hypothetical protein JAAARDRAFT_205570 [Jaapia argillacea MUCL 33604]